MMVRIALGVLMTLIAIGACFFVAGNLDPFSWDGGGRFLTVFIAIATFGLTVTCPYLETKK
jgi:hypothetical protein